MIFGERFTITVDAQFQGQNVVNVMHAKVRDVLGLTEAAAATSFCQDAATPSGFAMATQWLRFNSSDYKIDRVIVKSVTTEAVIDGSGLSNLGVGFAGGGAASAYVGQAQFVQFSAPTIPRKYSRGTFFPITRLDHANTNGTLTTSGQAYINAIAGSILSWGTLVVKPWFFYVRNSATGSTDVVASAQYTPWWTAMERRTLRGQP